MTEANGPHTGQHVQGCVSCYAAVEHDGSHMEDCAPCRVIRSRRAVLLTRALHAPEGLTPYEFTKGFTKSDALAFWVDAKALGLIGVGKSRRGARMFALPSYEVPL